MAGLFKNKIIKEKIERYEIPDFEQKISLVQQWSEAYKNGELQKKNETQCEQAFNQDFFIHILGYSAFPKDNYTIQPKDNVESGGGQMPDATLGYFNKDGKRVVAVVEIKDVNTSLDKSQYREGNLSPIQQAFKYKPQYKECGFVIATNFFELRLFRDNQLDYEKFTLTDLVDPKDDYFNFRKFFFLLNVKNFVTEKGQTETELLLSAIRIEQEKITNRFYAQYKGLRESLITDIVSNNKDLKRVDFYPYIVEKAQKIVDRVVFICFFEDCGLLPENRLAEVVEYAQSGKLSEPIWETLKKFFRAVDEGSEKLGVPNGYNGELFKPDNDLNELKISDAICKRFVELTKFDFQEDLSVNILGHIFEQSITDLERLKQYSQGSEVATDKKDTKRKKDGIFYTPEYIVDYIVKNSLGKYLHEKEQEILQKFNLDDKRTKEAGYNKKLIQAYSEYSQFLRAVKVLDPACGSGAFLVKVFDYLLAEHKRVFRVVHEAEGLGNTTTLLSEESYIKPILENNIYGVDLNPESVEITKLSLWLKSAQKGQKLITLKGNIKCGNSLIDDPKVAGERAFNWSTEFTPILNAGGFDVVVGNPPYVDSESMVKNDPLGRKYISENYKSAIGNWDLYIPFIEKSLNLLKLGGVSSMIVPNKWLSMDYGLALRELIYSNLYSLSDLSALKVFEDANLTSVIFSLRNAPVSDLISTKFISSSESEDSMISKKELKNDSWGAIFMEGRELLNTIEKNSLPLKNFVDVAGAFTTSEAYELVSLIKDLNVGNDNGYLKFINTGTIEKYYSLWGIEPTVYLKNKFLFPVIKKTDLKEKFPRRFSRFDNSKIIVAGIRHFECVLDDQIEMVAGKSTTVINNIKEPLDQFTLTGILNSKLMTFYLKNKYSTSGMGGGVNFSPDMIRAIPIIAENISDELRAGIKELYFELKQEIKDKIKQEEKLKQILSLELGICLPPKHLKDLVGLDRDILSKYVTKKVSMEDRLKMFSLIIEEKDKLKLLLEKVNDTTTKIDSIVYSIYGISSSSDKEAMNNFKSV